MALKDFQAADEQSADAHSERMNRQAERDWNAQHHRGRTTGREAVVIDAVQAPERVPGTALAHPLDVDPVAFKRGLELRSQNRGTLIDWLKDALKRGHDFDRLHVMPKSKCDRGSRCEVDYHFSKDQLFKPGAEKICGMLGVTPTFPNLGRYEEAAITGVNIRSVIIHCHITAIDGHVVAAGIGSASVDDRTDLNKALKMACKSAHVDATLRMAGLSEIFSHSDEKPETKDADNTVHPKVSMGQFRDRFWADMTEKYIRGVMASPKVPPAFKREAQAELGRRDALEFDDDIPF